MTLSKRSKDAIYLTPKRLTSLVPGKFPGYESHRDYTCTSHRSASSKWGMRRSLVYVKVTPPPTLQIPLPLEIERQPDRTHMQNQLIATIFMLLISTGADAGESFYGGIALGGTFATRSTDTYLPGNSYVGILGYQPNKYIGLETNLAYTDWKIYSDAQKVQIANASLVSTSISTIGYIPIDPLRKVFGKLGVVNGLYTLISCSTCTSGESYATSNSLIWGGGISFHTTGTNQPIIRLGFERYDVDTQLSPKLSVDHIYILLSVGI